MQVTTKTKQKQKMCYIVFKLLYRNDKDISIVYCKDEIKECTSKLPK